MLRNPHCPPWQGSMDADANGKVKVSEFLGRGREIILPGDAIYDVQKKYRELRNLET